MSAVLANNAYTTNVAAISSTASSFDVTSSYGFPTLSGSDYFYATVQSTTNNFEIMKVTAISGNTFTVTRAQESTLAIPFPANSRVELRVTAKNILEATSLTGVLLL